MGRWDVRPLGGRLGCLWMVVISIIASITLTILLNWVVR